MKDAIFIDVETGGLDPLNCALFSAGFVLVRDGIVTSAFEVKLKSEYRFVDPKALEINKIDPRIHDEAAMSRNDGFVAIYSTLHDWTDTGPISAGGHNVDFDLSFLNELMGPGRLKELFGYRRIDTASIARFLMDAGRIPTMSASLETLVLHFGIAPGVPHEALKDALLTAHLYKSMVGLVG